MGPIEAKIGKMERQLSQWGAKLDTLVDKAEAAGADVKIEYRHLIDDLIVKHERAQSKLDEFRAAGADKWDILKEGVEAAWGELEAAFENLKT